MKLVTEDLGTVLRRVEVAATTIYFSRSNWYCFWFPDLLNNCGIIVSFMTKNVASGQESTKSLASSIGQSTSFCHNFVSED